MKRLCLMGLALFGALTLIGATMFAQPPEDESRPSRKGPPPGREGPPRPPRFELGRVLPPPLREDLELTPEQEQQLSKLEKEVKERLLKILTDEQKKKVREFEQRGPRRPPGPSDGGPRRPPQQDDGKRRPPPRDDRPVDRETSARGGISWFATWDSGLREAQRSGRPILLVSAAPHCAGVSGIW